MPNREPGYFDLNRDVEQERVKGLTDACIDAMDEWATKKGGGKFTSLEGIEAAAMNLCIMTQRAPDDVTTAELANRAIEFIVRNCGVDPAFLLAFRAVRRASSLEGVQPKGSA